MKRIGKREAAILARTNLEAVTVEAKELAMTTGRKWIVVELHNGSVAHEVAKKHGTKAYAAWSDDPALHARTGGSLGSFTVVARYGGRS